MPKVQRTPWEDPFGVGRSPWNLWEKFLTLVAMKKDSAVHVKSYAFALRVVRLYQYLTGEKREYVLSKQLLRSGTAVGALVRESEHGQSKADFIHKLQIALKEANESLYWIELLHDAGYLNVDAFDSLYPQAEELVKLLVSIIKTSKLRIES